MLGVLGALGAQGAKVHKRAWWIKVLGNLGVRSLGGTAWELGALGANFGGQGDYGVLGVCGCRVSAVKKCTLTIKQAHF